MIDTASKSFAFILMPFSDDMNDLYAGIKRSCKKVGVYAKRADEQLYDSTILQQIYNQISKADIIIAVMTSQNSNVFYETGYAHALGKLVILLSNDNKEIPFNLNNYPNIIYKDISDLEEKLPEKVQWAKDHCEEALLKRSSPFNFYIDGYSLKNNPIIDYRIARDDKTINFELKIDIHNSIAASLNRSFCEISFEVPDHFNASKDPHLDGKSYNVIKMPEGGPLVHFIGKEIGIMPRGWDSVNIKFLQEKKEPKKVYKKNDTEDIVLRSNSAAGENRYPFRLKFV